MYAVFGITRAIARREAVKKVSDRDKKGNLKTQEEYYSEVTEKASQLLKSMRPKQLSPVYSNLEEAKRYFELAKEDGAENLSIKAREQDGVNVKTGKPVLRWTSASVPVATP